MGLKHVILYLLILRLMALFKRRYDRRGMFNDYENSLKEKTKDYIALDEAKEITELKIKNSETENGDLKNYTITESNLYFNEDKKLVWSMLIDIIYTNHQGTELILGREIAINANTKEVLFYR